MFMKGYEKVTHEHGPMLIELVKQIKSRAGPGKDLWHFEGTISEIQTKDNTYNVELDPPGEDKWHTRSDRLDKPGDSGSYLTALSPLKHMDTAFKSARNAGFMMEPGKVDDHQEIPE